MKPLDDQIGLLLSPEIIPYAERISMPYLGYHLLRDKLTKKLLGESEPPILYWLGKDIGNEIPIDSADGLVLPFIRLGLGKLEVEERLENKYTFSLFHSIFEFLSMDRLGRTLSLECGIIAGAISNWRKRQANARMELYADSSNKPTKAKIIVTL